MSVLDLLDGVASLLMAIGLCFLYFNPRIYEGVVIKIGLATVIFSLLCTAAASLFHVYNFISIFNAGHTLRLGLFLVCVGFVWRWFLLGRLPCRTADWVRGTCNGLE